MNVRYNACYDNDPSLDTSCRFEPRCVRIRVSYKNVRLVHKNIPFFNPRYLNNLHKAHDASLCAHIKKLLFDIVFFPDFAYNDSSYKIKH